MFIDNKYLISLFKKKNVIVDVNALNIVLAVPVTGASATVSTVVYAGLLFCGGVGLLGFFTLLMYLITRERVYQYYFLFLVFNLMGAIINLNEYTWISTLIQKSDQLAGAGLEMVTLLAFSSYCLFTIRLLDIKKQSKKLYHWILIMAYSFAFYGLIYYFIQPHIIGHLLWFFIGSRLIILFMSIVAIIWVLKIIQSSVKGYFLVGSCWYFLGALFAVLRDATSSLLFPSFYSYNATLYFQSGIFLEILCFALALSYRIYLHYEEQQQDQMRVNTRAIYEKEIAQAEALALRIKINPHFLFNSLNLLKYYMQSNQNKKGTAYLGTFSRFIRTILEIEQQPFIPLERELDLIKHYFILEEARFDQQFEYNIDIDSQVNISDIMIPPMLLQPFLEEILWTRLLTSKNSTRRLSINIRQHASSVFITIEDNGNQSDGGSSEKFHKAASRQITAERIALYNKSYMGKITYKTINKKGGENEPENNQIIITIQQREL